MKVTGTYLELKRFDDDIKALSKKHPTFPVFHKQKILDFNNRNKFHLDSMHKKINLLIRKYVEFEEGSLKPTTIKEDGKIEVYKYASDENQKAHAAAFDEFINTAITIEY